LQGAATWRNQWNVNPELRCRVGLLPLGEFTVMIPEPHATLHGAVTWRNQCHDRATLQGVRMIIRHIGNRFLYFIYFLNAVWAWTSCGFRIVSDTLVLYNFSDGIICSLFPGLSYMLMTSNLV